MIGFGIRSPWRQGQTAATFAALAAVVLVTHLALAYLAWAFYDAGSRIFAGDGGPDGSPGVAGATFDPSAQAAPTPFATPESPTSRINILLLGSDSAEERNQALTDTLLVVSIDPVTRDVAMISFPRDLTNFELADGRIYPRKINSLMTQARIHPDQYPDGPLGTMVATLGHLLGAPIHYYAEIDLDGFRRMIDLVGGVTVDNQKTIDDPRYDWIDSKKLGFYLPAGIQNLDGETALAYVRSRQGLGDNDFNRARRQQQVLLALRSKLTSPEMLPQLPGILDAAADTVGTNFPSDRIGEMVDIAKGVDDSKALQVVLGPRKYATQPPLDTTNGVYTLELKMDAVAELSMRIFGDESAYAKSQ
jgi:polyisoprenyl-teichoic acid--peptidoglycan teichoic acid transferase